MCTLKSPVETLQMPTPKAYPKLIGQSLLESWHKAPRYLNLHRRFHKQSRLTVITMEDNKETQSRSTHIGLR